MRILSCPEETLRLQCKRCPIFKKLSDEEFATFLPGVTLCGIREAGSHYG